MRIPTFINIYTKSKFMYYLRTPHKQNKYCATVYHSTRPKKQTETSRRESTARDTFCLFFFDILLTGNV